MYPAPPPTRTANCALPYSLLLNDLPLDFSRGHRRRGSTGQPWTDCPQVVRVAEGSEKRRRLLVGTRIASEGVDQIKLHSLEVRLLLARSNCRCQDGVLQVAVQGAPVPKGIAGH